MDYEQNVTNEVVNGFEVILDENIGHMTVYHDGTINWEDLQTIKEVLWGEESVALEVYPPKSKVVNNVNARHLWRLGEGEFYPDLLGDTQGEDTLESRYRKAWGQVGE